MSTMREKKIEELAVKIRKFLIENSLWIDCRIYFNGRCFSTDDGHGRYAYNDPENLIVLEDTDPRRCFDYVGDILSMSFEGDFYGCLNFTNEYGADFDNRIMDDFNEILRSYGLYYELGNSWNLTLYPMRNFT